MSFSGIDVIICFDLTDVAHCPDSTTAGLGHEYLGNKAAVVLRLITSAKDLSSPPDGGLNTQYATRVSPLPKTPACPDVHCAHMLLSPLLDACPNTRLLVGINILIILLRPPARRDPAGNGHEARHHSGRVSFRSARGVRWRWGYARVLRERHLQHVHLINSGACID